MRRMIVPLMGEYVGMLSKSCNISARKQIYYYDLILSVLYRFSIFSGITELKNLQECDLSGNCLAEHVNLLPLADLPSLISLNLSRNPLSYDRMHRSFTCGYLHENVLDQYVSSYCRWPWKFLVSVNF